MKIEGLPVIDESEKITVALRAEDLLEGLLLSFIPVSRLSPRNRHPVLVGCTS